MSASASLEPRTSAVEPGGEAAVIVRVKNTGQVVDHFSIQVLGEAAGWALVEPPALSLFPGAEGTATVRFRPPRDSVVTAGERPFGVRVLSHEDPQGAVVEEGSVSVGQYRQTAAELVPRNSRGSRSGTHELAVDNRGNVPIEVVVHGADPDGVLTFRFRPPTLPVAPGRAGYVRVRVTAKGTFLTGPPRAHPFQLQVAPVDETPILVDGSMVQGPLVSKLVRNVAVAAVVAVVAGALLWFLALKPSVQSAAREAVATPLAQQSSAIAALQKQAASGGSQTPKTGGGAPTPAPSTSGGGAASGGQSFAHRLDQSGGGHNQYKVPAGTAVSITDVVFQNPGGDHGTVHLERDGVTLLVENLDNFRDLDYHFVSPISLAGNQTIQMSVQCPSGCPSAGIYVNGTERPA